MVLTRDFSNPANWKQLWSGSFEVPNPLDKYVTPIGEVGVPLLIEDWIIAIKASSMNAKPTWHYAGFASPGVFTSIDAFTEGDAMYTGSTKLFLNTVVIIEVPQVSTYYTLRLTPPPYFKDISYKLYAYIGASGDTIADAVTGSIQPNVISIAKKLGVSYR